MLVKLFMHNNSTIDLAKDKAIKTSSVFILKNICYQFI